MSSKYFLNDRLHGANFSSASNLQIILMKDKCQAALKGLKVMKADRFCAKIISWFSFYFPGK